MEAAGPGMVPPPAPAAKGPGQRDSGFSPCSLLCKLGLWFPGLLFFSCCFFSSFP